MLKRRVAMSVVVFSIGLTACGDGGERSKLASSVEPIVIKPAGLARIGDIDLRYLSYNVEMLEVTGGKFWAPYGPQIDAILKGTAGPAPASTGDTPSGMDPRCYQHRPPLDLTNSRLRKLAAALGPAYVRVSGTWANTTYFAESEQAPSAPPAGFMGVLSRQQWRGVIDFAKAVDGEIVTSFATGAGTRDRSGIWTDTHARRWVDYTKSLGGSFAAAEFMNEPNLAVMGGAPAGYDPAAYGRDFKAFRAFADQVVPDTAVLGPGSVAETTGNWGIQYGSFKTLPTRDMLAAARPATVDAFSYHHYGGSSIRCAASGMQTTQDAALSEPWLRRTDETLAFYKPLRDEFAPGTHFWLTETADVACGGNPWGATFLDTFRYLDQLGRLAKQDVKVVMHNTLAASDYSLLDERTGFTPKPNYWGALLWRRLMGATVLESGVPVQAGLHVYAHCLRDMPGGVALLGINTDRTTARTLTLPAAERYTLSASGENLQERRVHLNGVELALGTNDELPRFKPEATAEGTISLAPATITFFAIPNAGNPACR